MGPYEVVCSSKYTVAVIIDSLQNVVPITRIKFVYCIVIENEPQQGSDTHDIAQKRQAHHNSKNELQPNSEGIVQQKTQDWYCRATLHH